MPQRGVSADSPVRTGLSTEALQYLRGGTLFRQCPPSDELRILPPPAERKGRSQRSMIAVAGLDRGNEFVAAQQLPCFASHRKELRRAERSRGLFVARANPIQNSPVIISAT